MLIAHDWRQRPASGADVIAQARAIENAGRSLAFCVEWAGTRGDAPHVSVRRLAPGTARPQRVAV